MTNQNTAKIRPRYDSSGPEAIVVNIVGTARGDEDSLHAWLAEATHVAGEDYNIVASFDVTRVSD